MDIKAKGQSIGRIQMNQEVKVKAVELLKVKTVELLLFCISTVLVRRKKKYIYIVVHYISAFQLMTDPNYYSGPIRL